MPPALTYCGNVHATGDLGEWCDSLVRYVSPVADASGSPRPFPVGAWWNAAVATELADSAAARARVRERLAELGLELATLNVFPFGGFHADRVKETVYRPDWSTVQRVDYTVHAARAAAALSRPGRMLPLSTLPLGYGPDLDRPGAEAAVAAVAEQLARLARATGVTCVLALEPEPGCALSTFADGIAAVQAIRRRAGWSEGEAPAAHLGLCLDLCHLAVMGEDSSAALAAAAAAAVPVPKVQVSACLELRAPATDLSRLLQFDEPRYLHQTMARFADGRSLFALDLPQVAQEAATFAAAERVRTHFHVPVFWDDGGPLGSSRAEVMAFVRGLRSRPPPMPLLEVETYTWGVLPDPPASPDELVRGIARELVFVHDLLS